MHQLATEWQQKSTTPTKLAVNRDKYLRLIDGIVYGEDPRQGFVENNTFYHPELKFRFPVPAGWKHQNSPQQFQMADPAGKALMMLALAPGATLEEAAQALAKQFSLQPTDSKQTTVNGLPALAFVADQVQQDQQTGQQVAGVRVLTYLIQDGKTIYALIGAAAPTDFNTYAPTFTSTMTGFARLTEASKLNRQPERVRIKTAKAGQTLATALAANGIPTSRHEEMAILNGMQTTDKLSRGMLYKVVAAGK